MKLVVLALLALIATANAANIRTGAEPEKETAEAKEHDTKYSPDLNAHEIATEPEAEKFFNALLRYMLFIALMQQWVGLRLVQF
jgi:hypothetical protein